PFAIEALHDFMTEPELAYYFQTADKSSIPDYEVVYLPVILPVREAIGLFGDEVEEIEYSFSAFQRPVDLKLRRNPGITTPNFKTYVHNEEGIKVLPHKPQNCHYLHKDAKTVASISICSPKNVQGLIFLENSTLEVHPLTERLQTLMNLREPLIDSLFEEEDIKIPHIVKRANYMADYLHDDVFPIAGSVWAENEEINSNFYNAYDPNNNKRNYYNLGYPEAISYKYAGDMTLELAIFFDQAAYQIFAPHMNNDDKKLQDMLLAYLNGVQALYHHPSLGTTLELVLVRLDIMKRQPSSMPHYEGERGKLLDSFCSYQQNLNPSGDSNPEHWDMALYVSGLDFFAYEKGRKSSVTMGLATVGGVCLDKYACVIAEFGTTNIFGKPYPSAGFTSVYITAHEIGHNLGMHHDSSGNSCPKEGYVMSPSRGTNGETQWSTCSADVMAKLGPGQVYTAKKQCEILLRDKDAMVLPHQELSTICYNLQCNTPHRSGYYFAGPALEGTQCGKGKYCYGGICVNKQPPKPVKVVPGGWGPWKEGSCSSGCLEKSMGHVMKRRFCNNPTPLNTDQGCEGSSVEFGLCNDNKQYNIFTARVWMGCAIFCKRADSGSFYTPRIELNDLGVTPYFPDGTWCHREKNLNYYCIQHHCLPENFKFTKSDGTGEDIPFSQNAYPLHEIPQEIKDYFSLGPNGKPIKTTLSTGSNKPPREEDWETKDYIEVPELMDRFKIFNEDENFNFI
ncbi:hypothetical protein NQ314_012967, partial [Rhamnusium bicolor]